MERIVAMNDRPKQCPVCGQNDLWDLGIRVDVDPRGYSHTAAHEWKCKKCDSRWQHNGHVDIDIDYDDAQITKSNLREFWER